MPYKRQHPGTHNGGGGRGVGYYNNGDSGPSRVPNGGRAPITTMSFVRRCRGYMHEDKARKKAFR